MVAVYPVRSHRAATFFVHRVDAATHELTSGPAVTLPCVFGALGRIVAPLQQLDDLASVYFDQVSQITPDRWSIGRVVLFGEAARCVSLLAGQGAALAMTGAERLAAALAARPADHRVARARWERAFRPVVEVRQRAGRRTAAWFVPRDHLHLWVRDLAMRASAWRRASTLLRHHLGIEDAAA